jgi:NTE family protein
MSDKLALILSGGGARGAFEVGVLRWLARERPDFFKRVRIITGSSVGAINAAYLASHGMTPDAVESLADIWGNLKVSELISFGPRHIIGRMAKWRKRLVDGEVPAQGWLRTEGYERLIVDVIDWDRLNHVVKKGHLDAVAIAATEVRSGRTHIFVSHHEEVQTPIWPFDGSMIGWQTPIAPEHVLASASLPFLFSPVEIDGHWFCDGGLRQNTPLSPALRLGANHLLAVSLKKTSPDEMPRDENFPGFGQLLGKLFNSLFLDRLLWDLDRLSRINTLLDCVEELHGKASLGGLQEALVKRGRRPYQHVEYVGVRPSADIGKLAAELLRPPHQLNTELGFFMRRILGGGSSGVSDAASYLLFDGAFAKRLMDLGGQDAAHCASDIDRLLT